MNLFVSVPAPHRWVLVTTDGQVQDQGECAHAAQIPLPEPSVPVTAVVPTAQAPSYQLKLAARSRKKLMQALAYALEEQVAEDVGELHVTLTTWDRATGQVTVTACRKDLLSKWISTLEDAGLVVSRVVPEWSLIPLHTDTRWTLVVRDQELLLHSPKEGGFLLGMDMLETWWSTQREADPPVAVSDRALVDRLLALGATHAHHWGTGNQLPDWIAVQAREGLDLRQGEFAVAGTRSPWHRLWPAAAALAGGAILLLAVQAAEYWHLRQQAVQQRAQVQQIYQQAFPGARPARHPRAEYERRLAALQGNASAGEFLYLLQQLTSAVLGTGLQVQDLRFSDGRLTTALNAPDFESIEHLKQILEARGTLAIQLLSSGARDGKTTARISLERSA
jgi:general secretion pathway protein L